MALGYETTGTAPNLIANAGNAMTQSIRETGLRIQQHIIQHNTDKQVAGLLDEAKLLSVDSPTFQQDLIGVFAKYPMAASDPRAQFGAKLLHDGWETKQREKQIKLRYGDSFDPYEPPVTPAAALGGGLMGKDPMSAPSTQNEFNAGTMGAMSALGVPFTVKEPTGTDTGLPPLLPEKSQSNEEPLAKDPTALPSTLSPEREAMLSRFRNSQRGRPAREARRNIAQMEYRLITEQDQENTSKRKPVKPITHSLAGVGLLQYDHETREWNTVVKAGERPGRWLNTGKAWVNAETGEEIPISATENQKANLEMRKDAVVEQKQNKITERALRSLNHEIDEKERDIASLETSIRKRDAKKNKTPEEQTEMAKWQEQHVALRAERDVLQKERDELSNEGEIEVVQKATGKSGFIPKKKLKGALDSGEYVLP